MGAVELATGYVTLAVETRNLASQIGKMFTGADGQASKAGKSMGSSMTKAFQSSQPNAATLAKNVELAEQRMAAHVEVSARKQEAAKRKVEIAQAKLNEATSKYGDKSSQALTAADRLAIAEGKLETETLQASTAQNKLQTELNQSKTALNQASKASSTAAGKYATGWRGAGQKIKSYLSSGLRSATDKATRDSAKAGKESGGRFSSAFKGAITGVLAGFSIQGAMQGAGKAIIDAGDLEQSIGAIDSVFKNNAGTMHDWAKQAKTSVGISRNEYNELGTLIGAQLKNAGTPMDELAGKTDKLIGLGADLSSMFGGTTKEAVEAISSALKGEMDPIEKYGITLNKAALDAEAMNSELIKPVKDAGKIADARTKVELAQKKLNEVTAKYGKNSEQAKRAQIALTSASNGLAKAEKGKLPAVEGVSKSMAVQSLLFKQSADAQGNFAKESDTFAHKMQVAKARWADTSTQIATRFLPAITDAMGFLADKALPTLDRVVDVMQGIWETRDVWGPLVAGVVAYAGAMKALAIIGGIKSAMEGLTIAQVLLNKAMKVNPVGLIVGALVALVTGLISAYNNIGWFKDMVDTAFKAIGDVIGWLWTNVAKPVFGFIGTAFGGLVGGIVDLWNGVLKPAFDAIGGFFGGLGGVVSDSTSGVVSVWQTMTGGIADAWNGMVSGIRSFYNTVLAPVLKVFGAAIAVVYVRWFLPAMKNIGSAWGGMINGIKSLWNGVLKPVWDAVSAAARFLWNTVLRTVFSSIGTAWKALTDAIRWAWNSILKPVWGAVSAGARWLWNGILRGIFGAIKTGWQIMVSGIRNIWTGVLKPVWDAVSNGAKWLWNNILSPIFSRIKAGWSAMVDGIRWVWNNALRPAWDGVRQGAGFLRDVLGKAFGTIKRLWGGMVNGIKSFWDTKLKPVFDALKTMVQNTVVKAFEGAKKAIDTIWKGIANIVRVPVNFVIDTVYNHGLKGLFNGIADKLGLPWRLPDAHGIPAFADGGLAKKGWALVGEEGPELVNFSSPGRVYTASETQAMLAGREQAPVDALPTLAGSKESEALLPVGGFWSDVWNNAKKAVGDGFVAAKDWVVGRIADGVRAMTKPLKDGIASALPGSGINELIRGSANNLIDGMTSWAVKKDDKKEEEMIAAGTFDGPGGGGSFGDSGAIYDGPLGAFHRPSKGPFTSMYGPRWGSFHAGVDIAGGGPTYAALPGKVVRVGWNAVAGRTGIGIELNHGPGLWTYYGHNPSMGAVKVRPGDSVKAGQHIGQQGATGNVTGTHLHFEVHKGKIGAMVNPMPYLHDNGGWLSTGISTIVNKTGKPEAILNPSQWDAMIDLANHVASSHDADGTRGGDNFNIYGHDTESVLREADRRKKRKLARAGLSRV